MDLYKNKKTSPITKAGLIPDSFFCFNIGNLPFLNAKSLLGRCAKVSGVRMI